jgi:hypothetical protein
MAVAGSQAGHLLAYELRFGTAAQQLQSTGAHAYFPTLARTLLGAVALALIASLFLVGFARLATGQRIDRQSTPSLLRLMAAMYTLQLALFVVQETVEGSSVGDLLLWGLLGQLPAALLGAVALRWLLATLGPALASIAMGYEPAIKLYAATVPVAWPTPAAIVVLDDPAAGPITRRGPPPSF